jgi:hypothetical protein
MMIYTNNLSYDDLYQLLSNYDVYQHLSYDDLYQHLSNNLKSWYKSS